MRRMITPAALGACLALAAPGQSATPAGTHSEVIPAFSPLRHIDPREIACGRPLIAKMDAARITTSWDHRKFPAFQVIGNTYSVGIAPVTAYIIKTNDGLILIDTTFNDTVPWVAEAIESQGFSLDDIKIILGSHAHFDHQGGDAWMKEHAPNAKLMLMDGDVETVEGGTPPLPEIGGGIPPAHVDRTLHDGDTITLGDVTVTAWKTAGHTPGAASYEWKTNEGGKSYDVLLVGSQQAARELVPEGYPGIVEDQVAGWTRLLSLKPDVWLGGHTWQHDNVGKYEKKLIDPSSEPFDDPAGYRCLIAARAADFVSELDRQTQENSNRKVGSDK